MLKERVYDVNSVDLPRCLQIFGEKNTTASLFGSSQDQRIPKGTLVKAVEVDGGKDIGDLRSGDIELGE